MFPEVLVNKKKDEDQNKVGAMVGRQRNVVVTTLSESGLNLNQFKYQYKMQYSVTWLHYILFLTTEMNQYLCIYKWKSNQRPQTKSDDKALLKKEF